MIVIFSVQRASGHQQKVKLNWNHTGSTILPNSLPFKLCQRNHPIPLMIPSPRRSTTISCPTPPLQRKEKRLDERGKQSRRKNRSLRKLMKWVKMSLFRQSLSREGLLHAACRLCHSCCWKWRKHRIVDQKSGGKRKMRLNKLWKYQASLAQ